MKEVSITLWELTKEEAKQLEELTPVLVYNKLSANYSIEYAGRKAIFNSKYCSEHNVFLAFEKPSIKEKV